MITIIIIIIIIIIINTLTQSKKHTDKKAICRNNMKDKWLKNKDLQVSTVPS